MQSVRRTGGTGGEKIVSKGKVERPRSDSFMAAYILSFLLLFTVLTSCGYEKKGDVFIGFLSYHQVLPRHLTSLYGTFGEAPNVEQREIEP